MIYFRYINLKRIEVFVADKSKSKSEHKNESISNRPEQRSTLTLTININLGSGSGLSSGVFHHKLVDPRVLLSELKSQAKA